MSGRRRYRHTTICVVSFRSVQPAYGPCVSCSTSVVKLRSCHSGRMYGCPRRNGSSTAPRKHIQTSSLLPLPSRSHFASVSLKSSLNPLKPFSCPPACPSNEHAFKCPGSSGVQSTRRTVLDSRPDYPKWYGCSCRGYVECSLDDVSSRFAYLVI